mgnify:CR=1 FL=1
MPDPVPTSTQVFTWLEQRRELLAALHEQQRKAEKHYHWVHYQGQTASSLGLRGLPKDFVPKLLPLAKIGVDLGVNIILPGDEPEITVHIPDSAHRDEALMQEHQESIRSFLKAFFHQVYTLRMQTPVRDNGQKCVGLGQAVVAFPFIKSRLPDHPLKMKNGNIREPRNPKERQLVKRWERDRKSQMPWDVRSVHPTRIYFDLFHDPPRDYIEEQELSPKIAKEFYPDLAIEPGSEPSGVKRVIYCSDDWYGVWVNRVPVLPKHNGDGLIANPRQRMWYRMAFSNWGNVSEDGELEYMAKGMITDAIPLIEMYTVNINLQEVAKAFGVFAAMKIAAQNVDAAEEETKDWEFAPGARWIYDVKNIQDVGFVDYPGLNQAIFSEQPMINSLMELWWGPDILRGRHTTDTAAGLRTRMSKAQAIYRPPKASLEQMWAAVADDILWSIKEEIGDEVWVPALGGAISLKPDQIPDGTYISINFTPPSEEEKAFLLQEGLTRLEAGTLDLIEFLENYALEEHPTERAKMIFWDSLDKNPMIQEAIGQMVANVLTREVPGLLEQVEIERANKGGLRVATPRAAEAAPIQPAPLTGVRAPGEQGPPPNMGSPMEVARQSAFSTVPPSRAPGV